jgi:glutaredoxin
MDIPLPKVGIFTIYSKRDCFYCDRVKQVLEKEFEQNKVAVVECDIYLQIDRDEFLSSMDKITGMEHRTFPFVFHNMDFIGGCSETEQWKNKTLSFDEAF